MHEAFLETLRDNGLNQAAALLEAHRTRCVRLDTSEGGTGFSRLGGHPTADADFVWPRNDDGEPLAFLAQIDWAELPPEPRVERPDQGRFAIFYDNERQPWEGEHGGFAIRRLDPAAEAPIHPPADLPEDAVFPSTPITFRWADDWPYAEISEKLDDEAETLTADGEPVSEFDRYLELLEEHEDLMGEDGEAIHKMFGFADYIQTDRTTEADDWMVLLLQLASDESLHWIWGDAGRLYIHMPANDLLRSDYRNATLSLECY